MNLTLYRFHSWYLYNFWFNWQLKAFSCPLLEEIIFDCGPVTDYGLKILSQKCQNLKVNLALRFYKNSIFNLNYVSNI
jgi:hypothetical protein